MHFHVTGGFNMVGKNELVAATKINACQHNKAEVNLIIYPLRQSFIVLEMVTLMFYVLIIV